MVAQEQGRRHSGLSPISYTWDDNGNLTDRNGDGETDVGGAADRYLSGYGSFGFVF